MQKSFKKAIATFLVVLMLMTSVPLNGFVGMDWSFLVSAAEENVISSLDDIMNKENEKDLSDFQNKFEEDKADFSEFAEKVKDEAENVFSLLAEKKAEQAPSASLFSLRSVVPVSEETDFSWDYDEETHALTVRGTGDMPDYTEMLEQEGVPTPIAPWAEYAKEIEKVVIEAGITSVGDCAFALCTNLKEVVLPEGITSIGAGAFAYCVELVDINLPSTLISVDQMAFGMCWSVKELVLPDSIETIGDMAFMYMFDLEKINLPASLQDNGEGMFTYALSLKELVVPEGLKIEAVYDVTEFFALSLEHITNHSATFAVDISFGDLLDGYFDSIEYANAFSCLYKNYFKYEFTGEEAAMLGIEISEQELIEDTISYFNTNLSTNYAVVDFKSFEHVLAVSEEIILTHLIQTEGYPSYFTVSCLENSKQHELCRDNGITHNIIGEEENCVCFVMNGNIGDNITWSVDAETKTLTFDGLGEMADFDDVPEYVKYSAYIENISFAEGSDITSIGDYAFYGLTNLETISLPEGITTLGEYCFYNSGVKTLNLPASLNSTETLSFYTGTAPLEEINVAEGNEKFLSYEGSLYSEYVEYEGEMTYLLLKQPEKHADVFIDNTIGFFYCAFEHYSTVKEINVPDTVLMMTEAAFLACTSLETINIGNSKIYEADGETASLEIEDDFVAYCNNLTAINVDERNINYSSIDGVLYNKNVTEIITVPMGLNEVTVPETVTAIPIYAFDYDKLQKVTILNPDCEIRDESSAIYRNATICGYKDSTAEAYADTYNRNFEYIGDVTVTDVEFDFTEAKKVYGQFDSLDTTGIKVTIRFSDGTSSIKTSGFQVTGFNSDKTGEKVLTVTYRSYSETYSVTVTEPFFPAQGGYKYFYIDPGETIFVGFTPEETKSLCLSMTGYDGNTEYYVTVYEEDKQTVIYNGVLDYSNPVPVYTYEAGKTYYFAFSHNRTDYDHYLSVELVQSHDYYVSSSEDATCTEDGYVTYTCRTCGDSYTEYIWALGHNMVETVVSSATCTSDGEGIAECSRCDYSYDLTYTRLGHKDENSDEICDACSEGILSISVGETKNIQVSQGEYVYIRFIPIASGRYKFYSISSDDTYGYLYDANMNRLYSNDDDGEDYNFSITYEFEAEETYWWGVRYYDSDYSGSFDVTLECGHSGEWETVTESTCTSVGSKTCVCVQCGKTVTEEIPTLSHNYEVTETVPATCTEYGYERYDCTDCDDYYTDDIYPLGHDYIYTTTKEPSCTETGVETVTCSRCDYNAENTIAKTMHADDNSDAVCDVCEAEILYISVDETKNIMVNEGETVYIKFVPAEAGRYSFYSDAYEDTYGYLYDSNMNLLSSDDDDGEELNFLITYDFEAGKVYYFGARYLSSSDSGSFDVTLECAHDGDWEIVTEATCASVGLESCVCNLCGKTVTKEIPKLSHNYELTETVSATCTEDGYERYDCTGCDEYYTNTLHSSGHDYIYTVTKEATCAEAGKQTVTCSKCDYSEEKEIAKIRCTDVDNDYICDICGNEIPYITVGETKTVEVAEGETVYIKYIPTVSGAYKFYSTASNDTYGYLYDADMNQITYNDDGGENTNFLITYDFESGKVYYFGVRYYSSSNSGSFDIILECSHLDVEYDGICDRCGASSSVASGTCGENLIWNIYGTTLVISGIGDMDDYYYISTDSRASWYPYLSGITNIIIQDGVTSIGSTAFADGYNVTDVTIPNSVTSIGETAFYRCYNLTNAVIPEGVQIIDDDAFCCCNNLINVIIPESVTTIGDQAFRDCEKLTNITIPDGVTSIGDGAFSECYNLERIVVSDNNSNYSSDENGVLFDKNKSTIICYPAGATNEYVIPDTVVTIGDNSFFGCNNLTNITISDNVTSIGYMAFFGCTSLRNIIIPNSIKTLGYQAFDNCYNLEKIIINSFDCEIPDSEYTIYSGAVIYGHEKSTAQAYAEKYGRSFIATPCEAVFVEAKDATCTEKGNITYYYCSVCGLYYSDESCTTRIDEANVFIDDLGHNYGDWVVNKEPTCTENGEQSRVCSRCKEEETGVVDATGHTVGELIEEVLPTCTEVGYTKGTCSVCGEEFENSVAALGHTYSDEWEIAQELSCVTDEIKVKTCDTCGEKSGLIGITAEDFPKCTGTDYTHYMDTTFDSYSVPNASRIVLHFSANSYLESGYDYIYVYAGNSAVEENLVGRYTGSLADTIVNVNASSFTIRMTTDGSVTTYGFEISSIDSYSSDNVEITLATGHSYGDWVTTLEATCENNGTQEKACSTCGNVTTKSLSALGHDYIYTTTKEASCTETGVETVTCSRCDYSAENIIAKIMHSDENGDNICDVCEGEILYISVGETKNITVNEGETVYIEYIPSISGTYKFYSTASTDTYGYLYDADMNQITYNDDGGENNNFLITYDFEVGKVYYFGVRYYSSSNSGSFDITLECAHKGEWEIITEATCTSVGSKTCVCVQCGKTVTEEIPTLSHNYELTETVPATCTEYGYERYDCTGCDEYYTDDIYSLGHDYIYTTTKEATCTETGVESVTCSRCDYTDENTIAKTMHTDDDSDAVCDVCEAAILYISVDETKNITVNEGETVYIKFVPAESGRYSFYSDAYEDTYGYLYDSNMNLLSSDDDNGEDYNFLITYDFEAGKVYYFGVRYYSSSDSGSFDVTLECAHDGDWKIVTEATCTTAGLESCVCNLCGKTVTKEIPKLSHNYELTETVSATCTEDGYERYDCTGCDEYYTNILYSLGHNYIHIATEESTCTESGADNYICERCENEYTKTFSPRHRDSDDDGFCDFCNEPYVGVLDLVFVIDTTGSMGSEISVVKKNIINYANRLANSNIPYYIAVVDYRDFCDRADNEDYPYSVVLDFSDSNEDILSGVNKLSLGNGGDTEETVYSGLVNGLNELHWGENSVRKVILIGDAAPLDPEPNTDFTLDSTCEYLNSNNTSVYSISTGGSEVSEFAEIAEATGGESYVCSSDSAFNQVLTDIIDSIPESLHIHTYEESYTDATCTRGGITTYHCTGCGKDISTETEPLGHNFSEEWTVDTEPTCTENGSKSHHCSRCDEKSDITEIEATGHNYESVVTKPTCTEKGYTTHTCSVCGSRYTDSIVNELGHSYGDWNETKAPTCTEIGLEERVCSRCSDVDEQIVDALGHDYSEEWTVDKEATCTEDGSKSHHCSRCDDRSDITVIEAPGHDYESVITEPTCTEDGYTTHTCNICNDTYTDDVVDALGHAYSEWTVTTEPTCTKTGIEKRTCSRCGNIESQTVEALGHDYSEEWTVDKEATCTEEGSKSHHCSRCDEKADITVIDAHGHDYESVITEPTCTEEGYTTHTCSICEDTYTDTVVDALGHAYSDWEVTTEPTCIKTGVEKRTCSRCDNVESRTVESLGHDYSEEWTVDKEATCTEEGSKSHHCSRCDDKADVTVIEAYGHNYESVTTEPTCTEEGYTTYTCSICEDTYKNNYVEALGHTYGDWQTETEPKCTTTGSQYQTCGVCEHKNTETIAALGHSYSSEVVEPTCTKQGYTVHTCSVCKHSYKDTYVNANGHSYGDWIVDVAATVLAEGSKHRVCTVCEHTETQTIERVEIDIDENTNYGLAHFTVVNAQTLEPIEGASIFISTENDGENTFFTDEEGKVSIVLPVGKQTISAYAKDCLTRNLTINVKSGENNIPVIGLSDLNTYDVEIEHELMTDEEIEEAGIDTSDPANQHVYKYELKLNFTPQVDYESIFAYFNADGKYIGGYYGTNNGGGESGESGPILHYHVVNDGWFHGWCKTVDVNIGNTVSLSYIPWRENTDEYVFDGWYEDSSFTKKIYSVNIVDKYTEVYGRWIYIGEGEGDTDTSVPGIKVNDEITVYPVSEYFYLIIRGEVKWLKEMFDVEMLVINNSMTDTLEDLEGTLILPEGLSLAAMKEEKQSLTQNIGTIAEGESKSIHWYVRGDTAGSYSIEALLDGMVMPFEEEIHDKFSAKNQLQVLAGNAMNLHFEFPDTAYYGEDYPITITLTNVSDRTLYNVHHYVQIVQGMEIYYSDGSSKKKIETSNWAHVGVDRFKPGDKLIIETSVNIFFESEIMENYLNNLIGVVDNVEKLLKGYKAVKDGLEIGEKFVSKMTSINKALSFKDSVLTSIDDDKKEATSKLYDSLSSLYLKYVDVGNKSINKGADLVSYGINEALEFMASDNVLEYLCKQEISDIEKLQKKIDAFTASFEVTEEDIADFDIFDSIRTLISAIPIKYALTSVVMTEDESNTTSIPWSYAVTDAGPQYFGVANVASYIMDITLAIAAEVWDAETDDAGLLNLIPGFDDPFNYDDIKRRIIATENEIEKFQAKDATGDVTFNAYYVESTKLRSLLYSAETYTLSCDNESAVFENNMLTFTGEGTISFIPLNTNGGTLYIEDSEGNTYTYEVTVVEQHECKASEEQRVIINPTLETDGFAVKCCETCEDIMEIINLSASDCEEHSFSAWTIESEATCTIDGVATRICSSCGYEEVDFIDSTGHTEKTINKVDATCTAGGYTGDVICEVCDETISVGADIEAIGHNYETVITAPTCTEDGYTTNTCSVCQDSYISDETEKLGHNGGTANCEDKAICTACGEVYGEINPDNHKSIVTDEAVSATCTSTGLTEGSHCDACGEVIVAQTTTEKLQHTEEIIPAVNATCSKTGLTEGKKCSVCGEILVEQTETSKLAHSYKSVVTAPTCTNGGYTTYTCSVCKHAYKANETAKLGHNMGSFIVVEQPSCTENGLEIAECSRCDYSEVNELSATGHNYQDGVCTECGDSKSNNCSCNCHKTGFMEIIWKILRFFYKLFGMNKVCSCGVAHY